METTPIVNLASPLNRPGPLTPPAACGVDHHIGPRHRGTSPTVVAATPPSYAWTTDKPHSDRGRHPAVSPALHRAPLTPTERHSLLPRAAAKQCKKTLIKTFHLAPDKRRRRPHACAAQKARPPASGGRGGLAPGSGGGGEAGAGAYATVSRISKASMARVDPPRSRPAPSVRIAPTRVNTCPVSQSRKSPSPAPPIAVTSKDEALNESPNSWIDRATLFDFSSSRPH